MADYLKLTSALDTPLYVRKDAILLIEGFTFDVGHKTIPNHVGSRLTLMAGQWSETVYCQEESATVIELMR